jgi:23S rRNA (uracil1939-C5)-methyltransferase
MRDGSLFDDARDFRAVVGDEGVSIAPRVGSPTVREGNVSEPPAVAGGQSRGKKPAVSEDPPIPVITRAIHGETYRLNAESFFQANDILLPQLIDAAIGEACGETAIELYCGVGLFTLPLARRFTHVVGVEADNAAAKFARDNLANAGLGNAEVANQDVADWLEESLECADNGGALDRASRNRRGSTERMPIQRGVPVAALQNELDFLLLDPPRTGAESRIIAGILKLMPQSISYVSCDPATLARDLKKLIAGGYRPNSVAAFDMFPQTHHVETVVHLKAFPTALSNALA